MNKITRGKFEEEPSQKMKARHDQLIIQFQS